MTPSPHVVVCAFVVGLVLHATHRHFALLVRISAWPLRFALRHASSQVKSRLGMTSRHVRAVSLTLSLVSGKYYSITVNGTTVRRRLGSEIRERNLQVHHQSAVSYRQFTKPDNEQLLHDNLVWISHISTYLGEYLVHIAPDIYKAVSRTCNNLIPPTQLPDGLTAILGRLGSRAVASSFSSWHGPMREFLVQRGRRRCGERGCGRDITD
jgi:hypothetical protein